MRFVAINPGTRRRGEQPMAEWAIQREAEGWHGICIPDHLNAEGRWFIHPFVALGVFAASTRTVRLVSCKVISLRNIG